MKGESFAAHSDGTNQPLHPKVTKELEYLDFMLFCTEINFYYVFAKIQYPEALISTWSSGYYHNAKLISLPSGLALTKKNHMYEGIEEKYLDGGQSIFPLGQNFYYVRTKFLLIKA